MTLFATNGWSPGTTVWPGIPEVGISFTWCSTPPAKMACVFMLSVDVMCVTVDFQTLFDPSYISLYNVCYTSLPVLIMASFEQVCGPRAEALETSRLLGWPLTLLCTWIIALISPHVVLIPTDCSITVLWLTGNKVHVIAHQSQGDLVITQTECSITSQRWRLP